jgi:hypothetical protein
MFHEADFIFIVLAVKAGWSQAHSQYSCSCVSDIHKGIHDKAVTVYARESQRHPQYSYDHVGERVTKTFTTQLWSCRRESYKNIYNTAMVMYVNERVTKTFTIQLWSCRRESYKNIYNTAMVMYVSERITKTFTIQLWSCM